MIDIIDALIYNNDPNLSFKREIACCAFPKDSLWSVVTDNHAGGVTFDFFQTWQMFRACIEKPKYLIMVHTHPADFCKMSSVDENMVQGWCLAFGIPIFYFIAVKESYRMYLCRYENKKFTITEEQNHVLGASLHILMDALYGLSQRDNDFEKLDMAEMILKLNGSKNFIQNLTLDIL